ncbi:MAG: hypothetical protein AAF533_07195 [Acidobacteriota bacterium]
MSEPTTTPTRRRPRFELPLLLTCACLTAPFPFASRETSWLLGLPTWLWWSAGFTVLLSALTSWAILKHWDD